MNRSQSITVMVIGLLLAFSQISHADLFVGWSSVSEGAAGNINVSHNATVNTGDLSVTANFTADDPAFVSSYAALIPALTYGAPPEGADINSSFIFSTMMPQGSRLILFDLDISDEQFVVSSGGSPLMLVDQLETTAGETSEFPLYDALTGALTRNPLANGNEWEATVFDISGLNSIDVQFSRSATAFTSATRLSIYTVPEPGTAIFCCIFIAVSALNSRRRKVRISGHSLGCCADQTREVVDIRV